MADKILLPKLVPPGWVIHSRCSLAARDSHGIDTARAIFIWLESRNITPWISNSCHPGIMTL